LRELQTRFGYILTLNLHRHEEAIAVLEQAIYRPVGPTPSQQ
jgi:hypothetical protein